MEKFIKKVRKEVRAHKVTSINLTREQHAFLVEKNIDISPCVRALIDEYLKATYGTEYTNKESQNDQ